MNTGIKAPEGMGIVVETADIQNCNIKTGSRKDREPGPQVFHGIKRYCEAMPNGTQQDGGRGYLHDEEEEKDDEDADARVQPHGGAAQPGRSRRCCDFGPGEIIKQGVDALSGHQLPEATDIINDQKCKIRRKSKYMQR